MCNYKYKQCEENFPGAKSQMVSENIKITCFELTYTDENDSTSGCISVSKKDGILMLNSAIISFFPYIYHLTINLKQGMA